MAAARVRKTKLNHQEEIIGLLLNDYKEQDKKTSGYWVRRDII